LAGPHTIPGSQPEEQVRKDAGDPVRSIIRAKEIDVSNSDGVAGSGLGAKPACDCPKGKRLRDGWIPAGVAIGGANDVEVAWDGRVSGPEVRGEELGVGIDMSEGSLKLSYELLREPKGVPDNGVR